MDVPKKLEIMIQAQILQIFCTFGLKKLGQLETMIQAHILQVFFCTFGLKNWVKDVSSP